MGHATTLATIRLGLALILTPAILAGLCHSHNIPA